jgi:hypothetical protein
MEESPERATSYLLNDVVILRVVLTNYSRIINRRESHQTIICMENFSNSSWGQEIVDEDEDAAEGGSDAFFADQNYARLFDDHKTELEKLNKLVQKASVEAQGALINSTMRKYDPRECESKCSKGMSKYTSKDAPERREFRRFCSHPEIKEGEVFVFFDNAIFLDAFFEKGNGAAFMELFHWIVQCHVSLLSPVKVNLCRGVRRELEAAHQSCVKKEWLPELEPINTRNKRRKSVKLKETVDILMGLMQLADHT